MHRLPIHDVVYCNIFFIFSTRSNVINEARRTSYMLLVYDRNVFLSRCHNIIHNLTPISFLFFTIKRVTCSLSSRSRVAIIIHIYIYEIGANIITHIFRFISIFICCSSKYKLHAFVFVPVNFFISFLLFAQINCAFSFYIHFTIWLPTFIPLLFFITQKFIFQSIFSSSASMHFDTFIC